MTRWSYRTEKLKDATDDRRDPGGVIVTTFLGIAGAFVGNFVARGLGLQAPAGWIGSILGAMLLLFVYRLLKKG